MLKAHKYRLYPTIEQEILLAKHFSCARLIFNLGLEAKQLAYSGWKNSLSYTREWVCSACGTLHDRDENACPNIISSAFEKFEKHRDGTLGESSALPSPQGTRQQRTKNQEKFRKDAMQFV